MIYVLVWNFKFLSNVLQDVKYDGNDKDESISDAAIAEMEAGIYGLQVLNFNSNRFMHDPVLAFMSFWYIVDAWWTSKTLRTKLFILSYNDFGMGLKSEMCLKC